MLGDLTRMGNAHQHTVRSQPARRAILAFQVQFCFQLLRGRPSVPQQVVPSAVSITTRSANRVQTEKSFGLLAQRTCRNKVHNSSSAPVSVHLSCREQGKAGGRGLGTSSSPENGFL